jgi:predicted GNAT family acetyltransferase
MDVAMKPGARMHGPASLRLSFNTTVPAHLRGGLLELSHLTTPSQHRRQGYASILMQKVCAEADRAGKLLLLRPLPFDGDGPDQQQLADWYSRFGFDPIQESPLLMARPAGAQPRFAVKPLVFTMAEAIDG